MSSDDLPGWRIAELSARVVLPAHGPILVDPQRAVAKALTRAQRLVDDPDGALWYGARRILAYALMIRGGIPSAEIEQYLIDRAWLTDAARLLRRDAEEFAQELLSGMESAGAIVQRDGRLHAAAPHTEVDPATMRHPYPREWPEVQVASRR
ncbi:hypothetical protein [Mobilicoccus caccae]|uniref:Uncharacterized protein n=1 Tax=Mobilicoccus caccae TaxID=1859295 RepID=A0ABQ6IM89_9MICO|nr:hypothetical protein [Mobilicoccus caccae]GMA38541.1 hypothetical protein GCM10025883_05860 [Mobilicoccus caccae]